MSPEGVAIWLLSTSTLVLFAIVLIQRRRARLGSRREGIRDLMRQMERLAEDVDRRMGGALADMQAAIADADERIQTLGELSGQPATDEAGSNDESPQQTAIPDDRPPEPNTMSAPAHVPTAGRTHQDVLGLNRDGLTPAEIAEHLNRPIGEVDLILRLHAPVASARHPQ